MASFGELSSNFFHPLWLVSLSDLRPNVMVPHAFDAVCAVFVSEPLPHSTRLRTSLHDELHDEASTPDQPPALLFQVVPELMYGVRCRSVRVSEQIQECRRSAPNTALPCASTADTDPPWPGLSVRPLVTVVNDTAVSAGFAAASRVLTTRSSEKPPTSARTSRSTPGSTSG